VNYTPLSRTDSPARYGSCGPLIATQHRAAGDALPYEFVPRPSAQCVRKSEAGFVEQLTKARRRDAVGVGIHRLPATTAD